MTDIAVVVDIKRYDSETYTSTDFPNRDGNRIEISKGQIFTIFVQISDTGLTGVVTPVMDDIKLYKTAIENGHPYQMTFGKVTDVDVPVEISVDVYDANRTLVRTVQKSFVLVSTL